MSKSASTQPSSFATGDHTVIASEGADPALLEELHDPVWVADRYGHVVIASGDHSFADAVAAVKFAGCPVTVIAPDVGLSKRMRLVAGPDLVRLGSPFPADII